MRNDLKPMKNASFLGVNDGNTMRNAISQFISHSIISLITNYYHIIYENMRNKYEKTFAEAEFSGDC